MVIRKMNKKGAEGISFTTVLVVFSILVLVGGVVFFSNVAEAGSSLGKHVPSKLQALASVCGPAGANGLTESYCYQPRPIDKRDNVWVTCDHARKVEGVVFDIDTDDQKNIPECNPSTLINRVNFYRVEYGLDNTDFVNGRLVSDWGIEAAAEEAVPTTGEPTADPSNVA